MGTRSTVKFIETYEDGKETVCAIYQQYDGYIEGVGHDLANFLKAIKIINGISRADRQDMLGRYANGMGCLAAQYIKAMKTEVGGLYITTAEDSQEYNYEVYDDDGKPKVKVLDFDGTPEELLNYKEVT